MTDKYILDADDNPVPCHDLLEWGKWMQNANRTLRRTEIGGSVVSTVFLGLNHNILGQGIPMLWETMIFNGANDGYQERYASKEAALTGHEEAITLVKGSLQ